MTGMMCGAAGAAAAAAVGSIVPAVTDIVIENTVSSGLCNAGIVFNASGVAAGTNNELFKRHNSVYTLMGDDDAGSPVDHTGEWTPDPVTGSEWEVACISLTSGSWDVEHAAVGVYTSFATADMDWHENRTGGKGYTPGTDQCIAQFRIREVADTGNFVDFEVNASAIQT